MLKFRNLTIFVSFFFNSCANLLIFSHLREGKSINSKYLPKLLTIVKLLNKFIWLLWEKILSLPQFYGF